MVQKNKMAGASPRPTLGLVHFGASENDEKKIKKLTFRQMI